MTRVCTRSCRWLYSWWLCRRWSRCRRHAWTRRFRRTQGRERLNNSRLSRSRERLNDFRLSRSRARNGIIIILRIRKSSQSAHRLEICTMLFCFATEYCASDSTKKKDKCQSFAAFAAHCQEHLLQNSTDLTLMLQSRTALQGV